MTLPNVQGTKTDGNTGVVRPGADGICAIIAPGASGTANQAASYAKGRTLGEDFGGGLLPELGAWMLQFTQKPIVAVKSSASVAAALSAVTHAGAGTSVVTVSGTPIDDYQAIVKIVAGGTIGPSAFLV